VNPRQKKVAEIELGEAYEYDTNITVTTETWALISASSVLGQCDDDRDRYMYYTDGIGYYDNSNLCFTGCNTTEFKLTWYVINSPDSVATKLTVTAHLPANLTVNGRTI